MCECICHSGDAQQVLQSSNLTSNDPTLCFGDTVEFFCHCLVEQSDVTPFWYTNKDRIFQESGVSYQNNINETTSKLRVMIGSATFSDEPVNLTCCVHLTNGKQCSNSIEIDPQGRYTYTVCIVQTMPVIQ